MSEGAGPLTPETPADPTAALPDDLAILRQMVCELLDALRQARRENEQLQHRLDLLLRRLYGPRTERFNPDQPLLIPDAFEAMPPETSETGDPGPHDPQPGKAPTITAPPHPPSAVPKRPPGVPPVARLARGQRRR